MTLSQVMATPATMMIFAISNSNAEYLGNGNGSAFKSSFLFGDYLFEVETDAEENIRIDLYQAGRIDGDNILSIKRPMAHSLENAVAAVEELCYNIYQELAEKHLDAVKDALLGFSADECYKQWCDCLNEVLSNLAKKDMKVDTSGNYVQLFSVEEGILYLNARQYLQYAKLRDSVAK